jgi:hypothetical protein
MHVIEIIGSGCARCEKTTAEVRAVVDRAQIDAEVRHVTEPFVMVARGALFSVPVVLSTASSVEGPRAVPAGDRAMTGCRIRPARD